MADVIERNLAAYNAHDLEAFIDCFASDAMIEDGVGNSLARGIDAIRARYRDRWEANPRLHSEILNRIRVGAYVIDDEHLTGFADGGEAHVVLVYRVENGLIVHVRYLA